MPKIDESVINFAVYEDSVEYAGMAKASLPDLNALTQSISGAGIAGMWKRLSLVTLRP